MRRHLDSSKRESHVLRRSRSHFHLDTSCRDLDNGSAYLLPVLIEVDGWVVAREGPSDQQH
eukprot:2632056-Pleurochrysis_carterae.AAC.1